MEYRKFRLVNGNGTIYTLTEKTFKVFGAEPQGLGYTKTQSTLRLGDSNIELYSIINLDTISFEMLFYDDKLSDKYQKYEDFIRFLAYKPLYLQYQRPNSFDWFRRQVESLSMTKTEVNHQDKMLHCGFVMQSMSFWEDDLINEITTKNQLENGKIYPITYPINYGSENLGNIMLISKGMLDSPLELTIDGTVTNPQYFLYDNNNNVYGRGRFVGTFDRVYINSNDSEESLELIRNNLVLSNPLSYQDLTIGSPSEIYVTFLKLKAGTSKLRFVVDSAFDGEVNVKWRNRYVSI